MPLGLSQCNDDEVTLIAARAGPSRRSAGILASRPPATQPPEGRGIDGRMLPVRSTLVVDECRLAVCSAAPSQAVLPSPPLPSTPRSIRLPSSSQAVATRTISSNTRTVRYRRYPTTHTQ